MSTIKLNLNKVISTKELLAYQDKVNKIHNDVLAKNVFEKDWLGWIDLPNQSLENIKKMQQIAQEWKNKDIEVLVVIGIGGSYLGAKAGYEFIFGDYAPKKPDIELLFAGNNISAESLIYKLKYVENKKFAINVISKSGTTLEPSIAFREFRKLLEDQVGEQEASNLIVATTDQNKGILHDLALNKKYRTFVIPDDVGGRFSVLTPVGLLPFICAGINVDEILKGAQEANKDANQENLLDNPCYQYAVARDILGSKYHVELMVGYDPKLTYLSEWWKQLYAESEGKGGKGIFPASSIFSTDLHSIGQMIQDGNKILFETVLINNEVNEDMILDIKKDNLDHLGYLDGKKIHQINWVVFESTLKAHHESGGVPNIVIEFNKFNEYNLGYLFQFFMRSLTMSAYLLGVNPFNQPGVEIYKSNMFKVLKSEK